VQVYRRMTTAGLRGTVAQSCVTRTHCGAATVAKLEPDFYETVAAYGQQKHRLIYPASRDSDMARTLRSQLGFQGQMLERALFKLFRVQCSLPCRLQNSI